MTYKIWYAINQPNNQSKSMETEVLNFSKSKIDLKVCILMTNIK